MRITSRFLVLLVLALLCSNCLFSQSSFRVFVKDADDKDPLAGVVLLVSGTANGAVTDKKGFAEIKNIPDGTAIIVYRYPGFEERRDTLLFPLTGITPLEVLLNAQIRSMDEVVITTTRSTRSIDNVPTRVEFIAGDEVDEKSAMTPGDIRMLLNETSGIQVQQTSAVTANSGIRIQGLDGRYTQILKDGFPLYSGFAGGLSIMQIPPLDLKQVEIIKGSASTLYGGGAIAGLINLISKTPSEKKELSFQLNGTSTLGLDLNGFYSQKFKKTGITLFASRNSGEAYDPSGTGFSAIPKFERYVFNPRLYIYFDSSTVLNVGLNASVENRLGGDMQYLKGQGDSIHRYFNRNISNRYSTQFDLTHTFANKMHLSLKSSLSWFDRSIEVPSYYFHGNQFSSYSELACSQRKEKVEWTAGLNAYTDDFNEKADSALLKRSYVLNTFGAFAQGTWTANSWLQAEGGLREDYVLNGKAFTLPRAALLFKISPELSSRIGGGLGYKSPTVFTESAEALQYRNVWPASKDLNAETSAGANGDLNFRESLFEHAGSLNLNVLAFYTQLSNPLVLTPSGAGYSFVNANGFTDTRGAELTAKLGYKRYQLFVAYTLTDTRNHFDGMNTVYPLTARHRINSDLVYEIENQWRIAAEAYYYSSQQLNDGTWGRDYWLCGFMVQKTGRRVTVYINFENLLNVQQAKFGPLNSGTVSNPVFGDVYAPLDGFVANAGIKLTI